MNQQYGANIQPPPMQPESKGKGCLFWGCITLVVLSLLGGLLTAGLVFWGVNKVKAIAMEWTDETPREIQQVEISAAEQEELDARLQAFGEALRSGESTEPLVLTEAELNAMIQNSEVAQETGVDVYVDIDNGELKGEMSWALPAEMPIVGGRYFNASADFEAAVERGRLKVYVQRAEAKGKEVPEEFMAEIRNENFAEDIYSPQNQAEYADAIAAIENISVLEIGNDVLTIIPVGIDDPGEAMIDIIEEAEAAPEDI